MKTSFNNHKYFPSFLKIRENKFGVSLIHEFNKNF